MLKFPPEGFCLHLVSQNVVSWAQLAISKTGKGRVFKKVSVGNIVQASILVDQPPQFAQDLGVPQFMEFSVLKLGKSQGK